MKVHTDIDRLPAFRKAVVTIGTFDGVHLGHQKIISKLKAEAEKINGETVIITFHPHPRTVVNGARQSIQLINTIEERIVLLDQKGIDHLVIVPFTQEFSVMSPEHYIEKFLHARFQPATVIIGYDHRFGSGRRGDYRLLESYSARGFFALQEIPAKLIEDITVSSTEIRTAVASGDIEKANSLLGYAFFFSGMVVHGNQRGRTIGFPTANIAISNSEKIVPGNGVYAVKVQIAEEEIYRGMMNIGVRPTVDGAQKAIEVNIFDFSREIYDKEITVQVKKYLRPEQKFTGLDKLTEQLRRDREESIHYFNSEFLH